MGIYNGEPQLSHIVLLEVLLKRDLYCWGLFQKLHKSCLSLFAKLPRKMGSIVL